MVTNPDRHTVLYIRITNTLGRRIGDHSLGLGGGFTRKYHAHKVIYFETYSDPTSAIRREKQLNGWSRGKKEALIVKRNSEWRDLLLETFATKPVGGTR